ncbi:MAG: Asp-tRNA(Asn)/Glu-tRNA(Gln) amidotransferase subunit GatC [Thermodesulfovibrionales bacterium]|nr:Asp-tRNA(Asn)/Glu-tRNA(Gln) amidotransferase subunit GatC [Thermodesulfovibrionales bacterium]
MLLEEVRHVMRLARIRLSDQEIEKFGKQMNDIVEYVGKLKEINTEGIEPTSHIIELCNVFREDTVILPQSRELMLSNAPHSDERFYVVPKIIE